MQRILVYNQTNPIRKPLQAVYCDSFLCRLRGLMFRSHLEEWEGLLLVEASESRWNAAIHTFFMRFDLVLVWLDAQWRVVDVRLAPPWSQPCVPAAAARYILEAHPNRLADFHVGDLLSVENI